MSKSDDVSSRHGVDLNLATRAGMPTRKTNRVHLRMLECIADAETSLCVMLGVGQRPKMIEIRKGSSEDLPRLQRQPRLRRMPTK